jgi:hypothetical protein
MSNSVRNLLPIVLSAYMLNLRSSSTSLTIRTFGNFCLDRNGFNICFSLDPYILHAIVFRKPMGNIAQLYVTG